MKIILQRALLIAMVIGFIFTIIAALLLPTYESYSMETGNTVIRGVEALKYSLRHNGIQVVIAWILAYFTAIFIPVFLGCVWLGLWNNKA